MNDVDDDWRQVRNLGPVSRAQLQSIGIDTPEQFYELGAVEAYVQPRRAYPGQISRNMLWALGGAELDLDWRELPPDLKTQLVDESEKREGL